MANDIGRVVIREFPYPIAHSYQEMRKIARARRGTFQRQFSHLLDTFEITVRFLSTVVLNNYAKNGAFDDELNTRLNEKFDKPLTLGSWIEVLRETTRMYSSRESDFFMPELYRFYFKQRGAKVKLESTAKEFEAFVAERNKAKHSFTWTEEQYRESFERNREAFDDVLDEMRFITNYELIIPLDIDNGIIENAYICTGQNSNFYEEFLDIPIEIDDVQEEHPMLICKEDPKQQLLLYPLSYFYDDPMNRRMELYLYDGLKRKKGDVKRLDLFNIENGQKFPVTENVDDDDLRELLNDFRRILEILLSGEFVPRKEAVIPEKEYYLNQQSLIASYTACFVGRDDVFSCIDAFLGEKPWGYFLLKGEPGIGKSAFMANLVKQNNYTCHFIKPEGSANYPKVYMQSLYAQLLHKYGDERAIPESEEELRRSLFKYIGEISLSKLKHGQKEVIVIDGLDELALKDEIKLEFLPHPLPNGVYVILSSRDIPHLSELTKKIDLEYPLKPLTLRETEKLVKSKCPDVNTAMLGQIYEDAQGNPLYIKCLLDELERGNVDINTLPREIEGLFTNFLRRFEGADDEDVIFDILGVLTVVRESLNVGEIANILNLKRRETGRAMRQLREFLVADGKKYSIFHRKFLDFLKEDEEYGFGSDELKDYHRKIIAYCEPYTEKEPNHYAFRHLAYHYFDVDDFDGIVRLAKANEPNITPMLLDCLMYHFRQVSESEIMDSQIHKFLCRLAECKNEAVADLLLNFLQEAKSRFGKLSVIIQLLESCLESVNKKRRGEVYYHLGYLHKVRGKYNQAEHFIQQSIATHREVENQIGIAEAYSELGNIYGRQGRINEAIEHNRQAVLICEQEEDNEKLAVFYNNLGFWHRQKYELESSLEFYHKSMALKKEYGDILNAVVYSNLGNLYLIMGLPKDALELLQQAMKIWLELNATGIPTSRWIGLTYGYIGQYEKGLRFLEYSLHKVREEGRKHKISETLHLISCIYRNFGKYKSAMKASTENLKLADELGVPKSKINAYNEYGILCVEMGQVEEGKTFLEKARHITSQSDIEGDSIITLKYLGMLYLKTRELEKALEFAEQSYEIASRLGVKIELPEICDLLADIYQAKGDSEQEQVYREESEALRESWQLDEIDKIEMPELPRI